MSNTTIQQLLTELEEINNVANRFVVEQSYKAHSSEFVSAFENVCEALEQATITSRNLLEEIRPRLEMPTQELSALPYISVSGIVRVIQFDWLHVKLNALLPHCRYQTPQYIGDTIKRLLDAYSTDGGIIPYHKNAMLIIDEHCDIQSRTVYDQDNKSWKVIPNTLKGRAFPDDDQFSLGVVLVSTLAEKPACNIFVIDASDAGEFFNSRSSGALYW